MYLCSLRNEAFRTRLMWAFNPFALRPLVSGRIIGSIKAKGKKSVIVITDAKDRARDRLRESRTFHSSTASRIARNRSFFRFASRYSCPPATTSGANYDLCLQRATAWRKRIVSVMSYGGSLLIQIYGRVISLPLDIHITVSPCHNGVFFFFSHRGLPFIACNRVLISAESEYRPATW